MLNSHRALRSFVGVRNGTLLLALAAASACGGGSKASGSGGGGGSGGSGSSTSLCFDVKPVKVVPPAGLQVKFRLLDCDGNPVGLLTASNLSVINDEKGLAFGKGGEGDSMSDVAENSSVELYSVVVLDMSDSIAKSGSLGAVVDGAKVFVEETVTKPKASLKHHVALIAFGAPAQITVEQDFTQDAAVLDAKLEALRNAPSRGTTDLYGAYMTALATVAAAGGGGNTDVERFVVLLTDGTHEAGNEPVARPQALLAKHQSQATVYTLGIKGNYDACRLEELAGRGGAFVTSSCREESACNTAEATPASCTQFFPSVDQKAISQAFQEVAARADGLARSNYAVGVCTPVALGSSSSLTLKAEVDGLKGEQRVSYAVSGSGLTGEVGKCDARAVQSDGSGAGGTGGTGGSDGGAGSDGGGNDGASGDGSGACGPTTCADAKLLTFDMTGCCAGVYGNPCGLDVTTAVATLQGFGVYLPMSGCIELNQPGADDSYCPDYSFSVAGVTTTFKGCCRPVGKCGNHASLAIPGVADNGPDFGCLDGTPFLGGDGPLDCTP